MERARQMVREANDRDCAPGGRGIKGAALSPAERVMVWTSPALFALLVGVPLWRRLRHPTLQGDDLIRLVDLIEQPCRELLFLPLAEHVAPLFQLVSWITWQLIGHDLRLAPLAFCFASVAAWRSVFALGFWLVRETGSRTASFVAVAVVAQSPLVRETAWWYSSSSFSWAIAGILVAVLGGSALPRRPRGSLALIAPGRRTAPAGTTIGILAAPLAILRAVLAPCSRRLKLLAVLAALSGVLVYVEACNLGCSDSANSARVQNLSTIEPIAGLGYALAVPGRMLWPSTLGVPATWLATVSGPVAVWGAGIGAFSATLWLATWRRAPWNRQLILVGAAMIYCGYVLTYVPRVTMLRTNRWSELQFLYHAVGRYHVLPLLGLAAIAAAVISCWPLVGRCDRARGWPAFAGAIAGLVMLVVQWKESSYWDFYLLKQDQNVTFAALEALGKLAREEGISRAQLVRIIDPVMRPGTSRSWRIGLPRFRSSSWPRRRRCRWRSRSVTTLLARVCETD